MEGTSPGRGRGRGKGVPMLHDFHCGKPTTKIGDGESAFYHFLAGWVLSDFLSKVPHLVKG